MSSTRSVTTPTSVCLLPSLLVCYQVCYAAMSSAEDASTPAPTNALQALTQAVSQSVMASLKSSLEDNRAALLADVKGLIAESTADITDKASKRIKTDNPSFNNSGNRNQYEHNTDVMRSLERAASAVLKGDQDSTIKALAEGKRLIQHRQKIVRLADREEHGWRFVMEYEKDKLADNSDDEKAIARARREANIKMSRQKYRFNRRQTVYPRTDASPRPQNRGDSYRPRDRQPTASSFRPRESDRTANARPRTDFRKDKYDRECHICGRRGHLAFDCRQR